MYQESGHFGNRNVHWRPRCFSVPKGSNQVFIVWNVSEKINEVTCYLPCLQLSHYQLDGRQWSQSTLKASFIINDLPSIKRGIQWKGKHRTYSLPSLKDKKKSVRPPCLVKLPKWYTLHSDDYLVRQHIIFSIIWNHSGTFPFLVSFFSLFNTVRAGGKHSYSDRNSCYYKTGEAYPPLYWLRLTSIPTEFHWRWKSGMERNVSLCFLGSWPSCRR